MILKVCGITQQDQFSWLEANGVDMIGINFYPDSPRFIDKPFYNPAKQCKSLKIGVFVNAEIKFLSKMIKEFGLDMAQLHGDESPKYCAEVAKIVPVIKVFGITPNFTFDTVASYTKCATYFLFDNKTPNYGGSGKKFDWHQLDNYQWDTPFLLSGGISLEDFPFLSEISHEKLLGIDINSGFEKSAGNKDVKQIEQLLKLIEDEKS